jgi:hypothetical protein
MDIILSGIQTICALIQTLGMISINYIITKSDNNTRNQRKLYEIKQEIASFLSKEKSFTDFTASKIEYIKILVIQPILYDEYLKKTVIDDYRCPKVSFDMLTLMQLVIHWTRGVLLYRKEEYISVADKILSCIYSNILNKWKEDSLYFIFPELSEVYGRVLEANNKLEQAKKIFIQAQKDALEINSFVEVKAQRLLLRLEHKKISKKIKGLVKSNNVPSNTSNLTDENDTEDKNDKISNLIQRCNKLVTSYHNLQNDENEYVLSYLNKELKESAIIPFNDKLHQLKCNLKLLSLELYKSILPLLLANTNKDLIKEDTKNNIISLLDAVYPALKNKKHPSLLEGHTIDNSNMNTDDLKSTEYNILLHSEIQDAVYVLEKMQKLNLIIIDDKDQDNLIKITSTLKHNYDKHHTSCIFMFIDNAKFNCMHAKSHDMSNKNIVALQNNYPKCLDLYTSNIFDCFLSNKQNPNATSSNHDDSTSLSGCVLPIEEV